MAKERLWLPHNANIGLGKSALESHPSSIEESRVGKLKTAVLTVLTGRSFGRQQSKTSLVSFIRMFGSTAAQDQNCRDRSESNGSRGRAWVDFDKARGYARSLGLESEKEWRELSKSGQRPPDIPANPDRVYKGKGWLSWGDFLGFNEGYAVGERRGFEEARDYARNLELKSVKEWREWRNTKERPQDIPASLDIVYDGKGWKSMGDFLGYRPGYVEGEWRSFEEARDYVRSLGFKSKKNWLEWSKSGQRPSDIPSAPDRVYKEEGWLSWGDFLGYNKGHIAKKRSSTKRRSFAEARDYVRSFGLKSKIEWWEWSKSGQRPSDIPSCPELVYKGRGWKSWGDFLGFDEGYDAGAEWRSFEDARDCAKRLGSKSKKQWHDWSRSGERPRDIPANPDRVYKNEGWKSWGDFLGFG